MRLLALLPVIAVLAAPALAQSPDSVRTRPTLAPEPVPAPPRASAPVAAPAPRTAPKRVTPFFEAIVGGGGDSVAELAYSDGETRSMYAGQGGALQVGARVRPVAAVPVSAVVSVGYKVLFEPSDNANVRLSRFPVALGLRGEGGPGLWAEASAVRHVGTTLHGDDFFADESYDSSTGAALAAGWKWFGAHYTALRYTSERDGSEYDARMIAVTGRFTLQSGW